MTIDTVEYTVTFPEPEWNGAEAYRHAASEAATDHVDVDVTVVDAATLVVTVTGDQYVLPVYEQALRESLPDGVSITCEVTVGSQRCDPAACSQDQES